MKKTQKIYFQQKRVRIMWIGWIYQLKNNSIY